jgi:hypothetical protein
MTGEKIIQGLEDAVAYAQGDKSRGRSTVYVTLAIGEREGGGLFICAMGDLREVRVAGSSKDDVFADIGPVLQRTLKDNHGVDWVKDEVTPSSGSVYQDLGIAEPEHGEVRRNGNDTYVWDAGLKVWVQTRYANEESR